MRSAISTVKTIQSGCLRDINAHGMHICDYSARLALNTEVLAWNACATGLP
jgi:hypothetical protein